MCFLKIRLLFRIIYYQITEKAYEIEITFKNLIHDCSMSLVLLPRLLSNFVYPLVLPGLNLCPALATDYSHKGLRTGSLPPSPHLTHSLSLLKGPYCSLLSRATQSHLFSASVGKSSFLHLCSKRNLFKSLILLECAEINIFISCLFIFISLTW